MLRYGSLAVSMDEREGYLAIRRGAVLVTCDLAETPATVNVEDSYRVLLASDAAVCCDGRRCHVPAESVAVWENLKEDFA